MMSLPIDTAREQPLHSSHSPIGAGHVERLHRLLKEEADTRLALGGNLRILGDLEAAHDQYVEAARLQVAFNDLPLAGETHTTIAEMAMERQQPRESVFHSSRAAEIYREVGCPERLARALLIRAKGWMATGDLNAARTTLEEAISIANTSDFPIIETEGYTLMVSICLQERRLTAAASMALQALNALATLESTPHYVALGLALAELMYHSEKYREAAAILSACETVGRHSGFPVGDSEISRIRGAIAGAIGVKAEERFHCDLWTQTEMIRYMGRLIRRAVVPMNSMLYPMPLPCRFPELTAREREILDLLIDGCTTKVMAYRLSLSPRTITTHLANIMAKLDVSSRAELVSKAMRAS